MSRKSMRIVFSTLMILAFVLSACQPPPTPETIIQTVVVEKEGTPVVITQVVEKTVEVVKEVQVTAVPEAAVVYPGSSTIIHEPGPSPAETDALAWARLAEIRSSLGNLDAALEAARKAAFPSF